MERVKSQRRDRAIPPGRIDRMMLRVECEIAAAVVGGQTKLKFLNNFPNRLRITDRGALNDDHFLVTYAAPVIHAESPEAQNRGFSARYLADTPQSFLRTVDRVMAEAGVDGKKIEQMEALGGEKFLDYILPVYVRLRVMGYGHPELVQ